MSTTTLSRMAKPLRWTALGGLLALACAAFAADQVTAVKGKQIALYASPNDVQPALTVAPSGLPWAIKEEKNAFYRVSVNGKDYWVDGMDVSAQRDSADKCPPRGQGRAHAPDQNAVTPGAGAERCR